MRAAIGSSVLLLLSACGGNVVVEQGSGGASTATTTTSVTFTTSSTGSTISTSVSTTSAIPECTTYGLVGAGLACSPEGTSCHMDYACCQGILTCTAGFWTAEIPDCNSACLPCGDGLSCSLGAICIHDTLAHDFYQCMKNPCPGAPNCSCASFACAMNYEQCNAVQMYTVECGG